MKTKYALERLRAMIRKETDIPEMGREKVKKLMTKPSVSLIRRKSKSIDSKNEEK